MPGSDSKQSVSMPGFNFQWENLFASRREGEGEREAETEREICVKDSDEVGQTNNTKVTCTISPAANLGISQKGQIYIYRVRKRERESKKETAAACQLSRVTIL